MSTAAPTVDYAKAFDEGAQSVQNVIDRERKNAAANALTDAYGPRAGDPDAWDKVIGAQKATDELPYAGPQAAATLGNTQATTAHTGAETNALTAAQPYIAPQAQADIAEKQAQTGYATANTNTLNAGLPYVGQEKQAEIADKRASATSAYATAAQADASAANIRTNTGLTISAAERSAITPIMQGVHDIYAKGGTPQDALAYYDQQVPVIAQMNGTDPQHLSNVRALVGHGNAAAQQFSDALANSGVVTSGGKSGPASAVSSNAIDYAAQQFRATGKMPAMGNGGLALKAAILQRAAQQAAAEGKNGQADAVGQQAFKARQAYVTDLAKSTPTSAGGLVRSAGALLAHADLMDQYIDATGNGNLKVANQLAQEWKAQTGSSIPTNLDMQKTILGDELSRYLIARGGGQADRTALQAPLAKSGSPQQLRGAMATIRADVQGQLTSQRQQADGLGAADQFDAVLTPRARALVTAPPASGGGQFQEGQTATGPNGQKAVYKNGQWSPAQ